MKRYCWYNTETKKFSESWTDGAWMHDVEGLIENAAKEWVLIEYVILTDHPDFTINKTMGGIEHD